MDNLFALIMAGGSGTRFWPASRRARPKQLLALAPGNEDSLLASTIRRILPVCPPERVLVVTGEHLLEPTRAAVREFPGVTVVAEPVPRNTAPCIGWGSAILSRRDPEAIVMALPSDHHVKNEEEFVAVVRRAAAAAQAGPVTTIGIMPSRAETGYGHIEASLEVGDGVWAVARFVEKPDLARAEEYFRSGRFFWNSGMFFFRASVMQRAILEHLPDLGVGIARIEEAALRGADAEAEEALRVFPELPNISIDYGVMEKLADVRVVPADFGWSDLGSWSATWELGERDGADNVADGNAVFVDSTKNLVQNLGTVRANRVVALLGVSDLCVVETDDALLVMPRDRAQDVRKVVDELGRRGHKGRL